MLLVVISAWGQMILAAVKTWLASAVAQPVVL